MNEFSSRELARYLTFSLKLTQFIAKWLSEPNPQFFIKKCLMKYKIHHFYFLVEQKKISFIYYGSIL
jgi:hypothetical protein